MWTHYSFRPFFLFKKLIEIWFCAKNSFMQTAGSINYSPTKCKPTKHASQPNAWIIRNGNDFELDLGNYYATSLFVKNVDGISWMENKVCRREEEKEIAPVRCDGKFQLHRSKNKEKKTSDWRYRCIIQGFLEFVSRFWIEGFKNISCK